MILMSYKTLRKKLFRDIPEDRSEYLVLANGDSTVYWASDDDVVFLN